MTNTAQQSSLRAIVICTVIAIGLMCAPTRIQDAFRSGIRDLLAPALAVAQNVRERAGRIPLASIRREEAAEEREKLSLRVRQLECALENAMAIATTRNDELQTLRRQLTGTKSRPLFVPQLIEARVLAANGTEEAVRRLTLDAGRRNELVDASIVLDATTPLIDLGSDVDLLAGQPVYAGRCVVGRVATVGQWTSTVLPISDPEFSAAVTLARNAADGPAFHARGILEGRGDGFCRITGVRYTEAVQIGDTVYSTPTSVLPDSLLFGRIVSAGLRAGSHWEIVVRPAANLDQLRRVSVLRHQLNPQRVATP